MSCSLAGKAWIGLKHLQDSWILCYAERDNDPIHFDTELVAA